MKGSVNVEGEGNAKIVGEHLVLLQILLGGSLLQQGLAILRLLLNGCLLCFFLMEVFS